MNLNDDALPDIYRRLRALETQNSANYTAVTKGAFEILSEEGLIVEGSAAVTGLVWVKGPGGELRVQGVFNLLGDADFEGDIDLTGTLEVDGGGQIKVGNMTLKPGGGAGGAGLYTESGALGIAAATIMRLIANNSFEVTAGDGVRFTTPNFRIDDLPVAPSGVPMTDVVISTGGTLYRKAP